MENREAIELVTRFRDAFVAISHPAFEAMTMAISALEKQETAKIVVGKSRGGVTLWHECSKCGEPVDAKDMFCSGCGRKLIPPSEPYTEEDHDCVL